MSDERSVEQVLADAVLEHLRRGLGYLQQGLWHDAVRELSEAQALAPEHMAVRSALAKALAERARRGDWEQARRLALRCVEDDPAHAEAFAVIKLLNAKRDFRRRQWLAAGVLPLILAAVVLAQVHNAKSKRSPATGPTPQVVTAPPPVKGAVTVLPEGSLPIVLQPTPQAFGLRLEVRKADHNVYDKSAYFELGFLLHNDSTDAIDLAKGRLQLLDGGGNVVRIKPMGFVDKHNPVLRPGDVVAQAHTFESDKRVRSAELIVDAVQREPAAATLPVKAVVAIVTGERRQGFDLAVDERSAHADVDNAKHVFGNGYFKATWVLRNTGSETIRTLRAEVRLFAGDELLEKSNWLVAYSSSPTIRPGEARVVSRTLALPKPGYTRYEFHVVELE